ncbi:MAG: hypothetical protein U0232_17220 [Thermomicrobiales bacterium]
MSTQQTSWWLPWMMFVLALAIVLGSFYYGGTTLGLPVMIGTLAGSLAVFFRRART